MVQILIELTQQKGLRDNQPRGDDRLQAEIQIAKEESAFENGIMEYGELSPFTCPECHGVLKSLFDGHIERFRCHTGHAFSADSLLDAITEKIEAALYAALRGVDESVMLLNHMGDHFAEENKTHVAAAFFQKANEARERASMMRHAILKHEQLSRGQILTQLAAMQKKERD